ncbi:TAXI family TRAP transporter solute-binding subunit [Hoeflea poritis]|uniref:TAXI family TRAP transporter solute-binding subunit n=1 Tax=Hoeflea poritis TaxID=2993659 RepID=A0ABT4VT14_9HYPH|nr:TAXI family TRAP transporter solute-binding subunit [Hoeflea poritis]MDA4847850.1 TAXI family TRAP transporter solute-binding subunit [Hoeflea poritis]
MNLKLTALALIAMTTSVSAKDVNLPQDLSWTAFGTTSSGYAQSVGIGQMLDAKYNVSLRIIPGENDVARMIPLQRGQSDICACGIASYFAQEGVLMFADKDWGPQRLYTLFNNVGVNGQTAAIAGDIGVESISDLRGKRVTWIKGSPANNTNMTALLAFGGLTWDDVERVEVPGWKQSIEALLNGQTDASWASTTTGTLSRIAASPRGLMFPNLPHDDAEGWARAQKVAPWFAPSVVEAYVADAGVDGPYEGMNYPYPLFVSTPNIPEDTAYGLTKAIMENFDAIKDAGPSMAGYASDRQILDYIFPVHPAAVAYYKDAGIWTDAHQAHNDMLNKRQDVLEEAWQQMEGSTLDGDAFAAEWMKVRAAELTKAGLPVVFN